MSRIFIIAFCFFPFLLSAQKKPISFYGIVKGGVGKLENTNTSPAGSLQVGIRIKNGLSLGIGSANMKFKEDKGFYIPVDRNDYYISLDHKNSYTPLFGELSYIRYTRKIAPYFNVQFGKALYTARKVQHLSPYIPGKVVTKGSYFYSTGTGMFIPIATNKAILITGHYFLTKFNDTSYGGGGLPSPDGFEILTTHSTTTRNGFLFALAFNINLPTASR